MNRKSYHRFVKTKLSMVVLAGGLSSRMGQDKADLRYQGKTFLQHQIDKGYELGIPEIIVSGYRGIWCKERIVTDRYPNRGPLAGLEASLREAAGEYCLVLSVDVPLIPVKELHSLICSFCAGTDDIMVLKHKSRMEPLIGIYRSGLAECMELNLTQGKSAIFRILDQTGYGVYESHGPESWFTNVNDPEVYKDLVNSREVDISGKEVNASFCLIRRIPHRSRNWSRQ